MKHNPTESRVELRPVSTAATSSVPVVRARRVIVASALWWLVALLWLWFAVGLVGSRPKAQFWILVKDYDLSAGSIGTFLLPIALLIAWLLRARFANCDWARIAEFIERRLVPLCVGAFLLYAALCFWATHRQPLVTDEYGPLSQSRAFAAGQISGWVPPPLLDWILPSMYRGDFFADSQSSGHFTSVYWPGLAISQVPFALVGANWLCNPLWGALGLWGVFRLAKRLTGSSEAAAWAWVLTLASPAVAINAASFFSMTAHFACSIFYALLLLRDDRRSAFWAGVLGGYALVLHNPVPHMAFALPWFIALLWKRRELVLPLLAGYLVLALPVGLGWSAFLDGFDASKYAQAAHASQGAASSLPFAEVMGRLETVVRVPSLYLIVARLVGLAKTVVWAVPGLLVLAWLGWRSLKRNPAPRADVGNLRILAASLFSTFTIYWLVPFDQGHGWGFRYIHSAWFALAILGALTLANAPRQSILRPFFAVLCVISFAILLPLRAWQVENFIGQQLAQLPAAPASAAASLTFIDIKDSWFALNLVQNDPFLRNDDWRLISHGAAANEQLARQYLINPRREQNGAWGEIWVGNSLRHPQFPPPAR